MTPRREQLVAYIESYVEEHGYSPSVREMAEGAGYVGMGGLHLALEALREAGLIDYVDGKARTVRVRRTA